VDDGRRGVAGAVDGARARHRSSTGYRQVFPRSVWILGRSAHAGPSD
jgi:hypothetical protein